MLEYKGEKDRHGLSSLNLTPKEEKDTSTEGWKCTDGHGQWGWGHTDVEQGMVRSLHGEGDVQAVTKTSVGCCDFRTWLHVL